MRFTAVGALRGTPISLVLYRAHIAVLCTLVCILPALFAARSGLRALLATMSADQLATAVAALPLLVLLWAGCGGVLGAVWAPILPPMFTLRTVLDSPQPRTRLLRGRALAAAGAATALGALFGVCVASAGVGSGGVWGAVAWVALFAATGLTVAAACTFASLASAKTLTWAGTGLAAGIIALGALVPPLSAAPAVGRGAALALALALSAGLAVAQLPLCAHLPERTVLARTLRRTRLIRGAVIADPVAVRHALNEAPNRVGSVLPRRRRLPNSARVGRAVGKTAPGSLWPGLPQRLRALRVSASRRPVTLILTLVCAALAIVSLVSAPALGQNLLWVSIMAFSLSAFWSLRLFDAGVTQAAHSWDQTLSGLSPAAELAASMLLPAILLLVIAGGAVALGLWLWGARTGSVLAPLILLPGILGLRVWSLFAPPPPASLFTPIPTALGDLAGVRVLGWVAQGPLSILVFATVATLVSGVAWYVLLATLAVVVVARSSKQRVTRS